jgi:hypothetical protein
MSLLPARTSSKRALYTPRLGLTRRVYAALRPHSKPFCTMELAGDEWLRTQGAIYEQLFLPSDILIRAEKGLAHL